MKFYQSVFLAVQKCLTSKAYH